jgi:hypothetical protein
VTEQPRSKFREKEIKSSVLNRLSLKCEFKDTCKVASGHKCSMPGKSRLELHRWKTSTSVVLKAMRLGEITMGKERQIPWTGILRSRR